MRQLLLLVALLLASAQAFSMTYFLTKQWVKDGSRFCEYSNGTVLNVGINLCALQIEG